MSKLKGAVLLVLLAAALFAAVWAVCGVKRYRVDYCGAKGLYERARDTYRAGAAVKLYFPYVATDTDYRFTLDGESVSCTYSDRHGFIITFVMPAHDVMLNFESVNSMEYRPDEGEYTDTLLLEYTETAVGTAEADAGRFALELVAGTDSDMLCLAVYAAESEEPLRYSVPYEAYERCFAVIQQNEMEIWALSTDAAAQEGMHIALNYFDAGFIVQVSSDAMPPEGEQVFAQLKSILLEYAAEENRI
ncbi:MAG: hypothetical protein IKV55_06165 [Oscillospiraceae bacterium]|nr:hypothetical protein [Oscillospiraceae bacterium]